MHDLGEYGPPYEVVETDPGLRQMFGRYTIQTVRRFKQQKMRKNERDREPSPKMIAFTIHKEYALFLRDAANHYALVEGQLP